MHRPTTSLSKVYCGPSVLHLLTGKPLPEIYRTVWKARGNRYPTSGLPVENPERKVMGLSRADMKRTLHRLGYPKACTWVGFPKGERPTLAQFLKVRERHLLPGEWLVVSGNHWIVLTMSEYGFVRLFDNRHPEGVPASKWPNRRARVDTVIRPW